MYAQQITSLPSSEQRHILAPGSASQPTILSNGFCTSSHAPLNTGGTPPNSQKNYNMSPQQYSSFYTTNLKDGYTKDGYTQGTSERVYQQNGTAREGYLSPIARGGNQYPSYPSSPEAPQPDVPLESPDKPMSATQSPVFTTTPGEYNKVHCYLKYSHDY